MLETALKGQNRYWMWVIALLAIIGVGFATYLNQFEFGLGITGMSRDVSWGFYIAQFTYLVGVAAGGVMVVMPYYLHNYKKFGRITIIGEFLAIGALTMCLLFIVVDLGQPERILNVWIHPTPRSILFWDTLVLNGYLLLNILVGWNVLEAERNGVPSPKWVKPFIYISIPFAFGIHTVTAYLYCGLASRGFWLTAILAPRFLASAFAAGPCVVLLICFFLRTYTKFDAGTEAMQTLAKIITYALIANVFFFFCEVFVVFYSQIPDHMSHLQYLFFGHNGHGVLVPWMWTSIILMLVGIVLLLVPSMRKNEKLLPITCLIVIVGTWIDKGLGMISGGFVPSPLHHYTEYVPTMKELMITFGVYAVGLLVLTILIKMAVTVKEEVSGYM